MLDELLILLLGCMAGTLTGLIPGIHPNTVVFSSMPLYFSLEFEFLHFASFLLGMSVSHTFHDFLPSIFLGVAEAESALASVPGAEMAARGEGLEAFRLTVSGGLVSLMVFLGAAYPVLKHLETVYTLAEPAMPYLLFFFLLFAVFKAPSTGHAAVVASLSAALGVLAFRMPVNQDFVLVPVFSGLFAAPAVLSLAASRLSIPGQRSAESFDRASVQGGALGFLAGLIAGIVPGVGAATSTALMTPLMDSREEFLASMGAVNTSDLLVSFLALNAIGKARSGAAVALSSISNLDLHMAIFLIASGLFASGFSSLLAFQFAPLFATLVSRISPGNLAIAAAVPLTVVTVFLLGFPGLLILFSASAVGFAARECNARASCMAVLIVPAALYYTGFSF